MENCTFMDKQYASHSIYFDLGFEIAWNAEETWFEILV